MREVLRSLLEQAPQENDAAQLCAFFITKLSLRELIAALVSQVEYEGMAGLLYAGMPRLLNKLKDLADKQPERNIFLCRETHADDEPFLWPSTDS
ncbi:hypothetical protein ABCR94_23940 [Streptomyces sp. 21So2-11]